jgi:hypothetical protein
MSSARDIILEVKRRVGGVNAPAPDETDIMAYLNSALRGIWNYAIELDSPRIEISELAECGGDGAVVLKKRPVKISCVYDIVARRSLYRAAPREVLTMPYEGMWGWRETLDGIFVLMSPGYAGGAVTIAYYPEFTPLKQRDEELPFASVIDSVVVAWTAGLINENGNATVGGADMLKAVGVPVSSLVQYFEGHADEHFRGEGPW